MTCNLRKRINAEINLKFKNVPTVKENIITKEYYAANSSLFNASQLLNYSPIEIAFPYK